MNIIDRILGRETSTDVIELLTAQHEEVDQLFEMLERGEPDRAATFTVLADLLAAHATVEEKLFYPAVMTKATDDLLHESVEEHLAIKRVLADLIGTKVDDPSFAAKLSVLKEEVSHHAHEEEEKKLFPLVRAMFDADQRAALGNEVLVMFVDLLRSHPYRNVPSETVKAAALPTPAR
jgi:hemerythrin superfamily protein